MKQTGDIPRKETGRSSKALLFGAFAVTAVGPGDGRLILLQENRRLREELERLATTDPLTGIANRRFFEKTLESEIKRAQRYERPLSVLVIDIDNFGNYNDRHGHPMGDKLLQDCAHLFRALLRSSDLVARYGGDEFAVLLPEISVEQGRFVADKLSKIKIGALASDEEMAISIGCAAFQPDMTADGLLELAGQDLDRAETPAGARLPPWTSRSRRIDPFVRQVLIFQIQFISYKMPAGFERGQRRLSAAHKRIEHHFAFKGI